MSTTIEHAALEGRGLSKRYGGTVALEDVSVRLERGEVHCLLGENGAGKSTFVRLLTGVDRPDGGTVAVKGEARLIADVADARRLGIAVVYQHPIVFPDLSITENIFAGRQPCVGVLPLVDFAQMRSRARQALDDIGLDISETTTMANLTAGQRQLVEIAKAISQEVDILILDEPTASLSPAEAGDLFGFVRRLRDKGVAILLISHRLDEIRAIGDRVTVLRDGRQVRTCKLAEVSQDDLVQMMVGRPLAARQKRNAQRGGPALSVEGWGRRGVFSDITFTLHRGEIVGMAGLLGAGRSEIARSLVGIDPHDGGALHVGGRRVLPRSPRQMLDAGVAYVTEDRQGSGLILDWTVARNTSLAVLRRLSFMRALLRRDREVELADQTIKALQVRPTDISRVVSALSGGNQQKVLLGKWLAARPSVIIMDEPTAGVDVGAKDEVHALVRKLADEGTAVLVISSDLPEVLTISDRILVVADGHIAGEIDATNATEAEVMRVATDTPSLVSEHI